MDTIYTIGYEGTDIEKFIATLKIVGVKIIADVRAVALSRKRGFSKTALRNRLNAEGIQYVHFVDLGDPKAGREAARAGKYDAFRKIYGKHLTSKSAQLALSELELVSKVNSTCLLCFERDPNVCHRSIVAQQLSVNGTEIFDLYGDSPARYVDFKTKRTSYNPRQSAAAA